MNKYRITTMNCNREIIQADNIRIGKDDFIRLLRNGIEVAVFNSNCIESIILESESDNRVGFYKKV